MYLRLYLFLIANEVSVTSFKFPVTFSWYERQTRQSPVSYLSTCDWPIICLKRTGRRFQLHERSVLTWKLTSALSGNLHNDFLDDFYIFMRFICVCCILTIHGYMNSNMHKLSSILHLFFFLQDWV